MKPYQPQNLPLKSNQFFRGSESSLIKLVDEANRSLAVIISYK